MKTQLSNWGVPSWVTHGGDEDAEGPRTSKPAAHKRQAHNSASIKELPPASNGIPLFREKLEALAQGNEDLRHRKERSQGGRFVQSTVYTDSV
jgi:hypothetical protein